MYKYIFNYFMYNVSRNTNFLFLSSWDSIEKFDNISKILITIKISTVFAVS